MDDNKHDGYAIFLSDVKAEDRYRVTSKPKVYKTRNLAEKDLARALKQGWKKTELKILKYVLKSRNIAPKRFKAAGKKKATPSTKKQSDSFVNKSRFQAFIKQLGQLSSKYGIAIQSVGGVHLFEGPTKITYSGNLASGNLEPSWG